MSNILTTRCPTFSHHREFLTYQSLKTKTTSLLTHKHTHIRPRDSYSTQLCSLLITTAVAGAAESAGISNIYTRVYDVIHLLSGLHTRIFVCVGIKGVYVEGLS